MITLFMLTLLFHWIARLLAQHYLALPPMAYWPYWGVTLMLSWLGVYVHTLSVYTLPDIVCIALFYPLLSLLTFLDWRAYILPRPLTVLLLYAGVQHQYLHQLDVFPLMCGLFWFTVPLLIRHLFYRYKRCEGLGLGDVFLLSGIAVWMPVWIAGIVMLASCAAYGYGKWQGQQCLPLGSFLCVSVYACSLMAL